MSRAARLLALILGGICVSAIVATPARGKDDRRHRQPFIRGMALGQQTKVSPAALETTLAELKDLGVSHVSVVVTWSTPDIWSTDIAPLPGKTSPDATLRLIIGLAQQQGLQVLLFPILDVRQRRIQQWRGRLQPRDWNSWWESYRRFTLHYAKVAAQTGTAMFSVGSELVTTEGMRERWRQLIAEVRQTFGGMILYSANWDHYRPVSFWDLVDGIGLTAYHKLAPEPGADEQVMHQAWVDVRDQLVTWAREQRRLIFFTEVGYPSIVGGAVRPWDYTQKQAACPEEQRRAYAAFIRAWRGVPDLGGVFFWNYHGQGGLQDWRYTPRGKPAARLIQGWYQSFLSSGRGR